MVHSAKESKSKMYRGLCQLKSVQTHTEWSEVFDQHFIIRDGKDSDVYQMMQDLNHRYINMSGIIMAKPRTTLRFSSDMNGLRDKTDIIIIIIKQ